MRAPHNDSRDGSFQLQARLDRRCSPHRDGRHYRLLKRRRVARLASLPEKRRRFQNVWPATPGQRDVDSALPAGCQGDWLGKEFPTAKQRQQSAESNAEQKREIVIPLSCCDHARLWLGLQKEGTFWSSAYNDSSSVADFCQMLQ